MARDVVTPVLIRSGVLLVKPQVFLTTVILVIGLYGLMFRDMQATVMTRNNRLNLFLVGFLSDRLAIGPVFYHA